MVHRQRKVWLFKFIKIRIRQTIHRNHAWLTSSNRLRNETSWTFSDTIIPVWTIHGRCGHHWLCKSKSFACKSHSSIIHGHSTDAYYILDQGRDSREHVYIASSLNPNSHPSPRTIQIHDSPEMELSVENSPDTGGYTVSYVKRIERRANTTSNDATALGGCELTSPKRRDKRVV